MEESLSTLLLVLMVSWSVVTAILLVLVFYRSTLSAKEDDQVFIDAAEQHHFREQQELIAKMSRLKGPIIGLAVVSGVLFLSSAGVWIYRGLKNF
jgi:hypothetical protein